MAEKTVILEIVTPERLVFSGDVTSMIAPGTEGYFQILHNHAPFLSTLDVGEIRVNYGGKDHFFATSGGFAEISQNKIAVLAETAEKTEEIDVARAEAAKKRAEERLQKHTTDIDVVRAESALYRAVNRIRIAGKH